MIYRIKKFFTNGEKRYDERLALRQDAGVRYALASGLAATGFTLGLVGLLLGVPIVALLVLLAWSFWQAYLGRKAAKQWRKNRLTQK